MFFKTLHLVPDLAWADFREQPEIYSLPSTLKDLNEVS